MAPRVKGGSASASAASAEVGVEAGDGDGSGVDDGQELPAVLPTLPSASVGRLSFVNHQAYVCTLESIIKFMSSLLSLCNVHIWFMCLLFISHKLHSPIVISIVVFNGI